MRILPYLTLLPPPLLKGGSIHCCPSASHRPTVMTTADAEQRVLISFDPNGTACASSPDGSTAWEASPLLLEHPKTGLPTQYLRLHGHLQEVNWFKERYSSWFCGDAVIGDGSLYLATPVDPLFLALPIFEASRQQSGGSEGVFQERDEVLQAEASPSNRDLAALVGGSFASLCDVKPAGDSMYYRLSDAKVLAWLRCKVKRLRGVLLRSSAAFAALDDASLTAYAVGALGEHLSDAWLALLSESCGIAAAVPGTAEGLPLQPQPINAEPWDSEKVAKRQKVDAKEVARRRALEAKAEAKAAQLRRETRGMKSISSLFGKYQCTDNA